MKSTKKGTPMPDCFDMRWHLIRIKNVQIHTHKYQLDWVKNEGNNDGNSKSHFWLVLY